jgi:branched-chain amino acid transport system substrate-binding protein
MRKIIGGIGFVFGLVAVGDAKADITIGVNLSTTGNSASLGIPEKNALAFAPKTIGGQKVKIVVYDDASDTTTAVQNVKRLVFENKVDLILGPSTTPTALSVMAVAAENKTPMLTVASSSGLVTPVDEKRRWIFKVTANDEVYAAAMVEHMLKMKVKTVAVIAVDDPYGESNTKVYEALAKQHGIKTLSVVKYTRSDTSATAQVLKTLMTKPDAVYIVSVGTPAAMPHVALIERGYKGHIYQTGGAANADFLRVGGKSVEGAFMPASPVLVAEQLPNGYPTKAEALKFSKAYEDKFGPRSTFASHIWDALKVIEAAAPKALKTAKPGTAQFREALRKAIEETKGLKGAGAVYTLSATDHSGVNQLGMSMIRVENGKWKLDHHADFK